MKIKQTLIALALVIGISAVLVGDVAQASCAGIETSIISCDQAGKGSGLCAADKVTISAADIKAGKKCPDNSTPDVTANSGVWGLLLFAINILTAGIGVAAVGGIVYGSILYTTAGDSSEKVSKARGVIRNVVIGIVAYALMYAGLNFLIPGGLFA